MRIDDQKGGVVGLVGCVEWWLSVGGQHALRARKRRTQRPSKEKNIRRLQGQLQMPLRTQGTDLVGANSRQKQGSWGQEHTQERCLVQASHDTQRGGASRRIALTPNDEKQDCGGMAL